MPKTYNVLMLEEHLYRVNISVEADSEKEAEQKALSHEGTRVEPDEYRGVTHRQVEECTITFDENGRQPMEVGNVDGLLKRAEEEGNKDLAEAVIKLKQSLKK